MRPVFYPLTLAIILGYEEKKENSLFLSMSIAIAFGIGNSMMSTS